MFLAVVNHTQKIEGILFIAILIIAIFIGVFILARGVLSSRKYDKTELPVFDEKAEEVTMEEENIFLQNQDEEIKKTSRFKRNDKEKDVDPISLTPLQNGIEDFSLPSLLTEDASHSAEEDSLNTANSQLDEESSHTDDGDRQNFDALLEAELSDDGEQESLSAQEPKSSLPSI
jgi:hypothetical protein